MRIPHISWARDEYVEIDTLENTEEHLDRLTELAIEQGMPLSVQIALTSGTSLQLTVGCLESHVEYYSATGSPLISVCRGPWASNEYITFNFLGEESGIEKMYCVPIGDAREAVRRYFQTRNRPDNIAWDS